MNNKICYVLIIILIIVIFLQRSCNNKHTALKENTEIKYDTIYKTTKDTVIKTINSVSVKYVEVEGYTPGNTLDSCKINFDKLLKDYSVQTVYSDTLKLDSIGTVTVLDTVWKNKLKNRSYIKNYKIPYITKTVTTIKQLPSARQLYIGGNLFGDKNQLQLITPGLLYKTKKDQIYQANIGINFNGTITYGIGMYYKIKLK